jgi:hypothetical protein
MSPPAGDPKERGSRNPLLLVHKNRLKGLFLEHDDCQHGLILEHGDVVHII